MKRSITSTIAVVIGGVLVASCSTAKTEQAETTASPVCEGYVALTFDDGPTIHTKALTKALRDRGMTGTYFMIGKRVLERPDEVKDARANGIALGGHTYTHPDMTMLLRKDQEWELTSTAEAIESVTGERVTIWRPPGSSTDAGVVEASKLAKTNQVMWTLDSGDWWAANPRHVRKRMQNVKAGDIVVLHDQLEAPATVDHLKLVLDSKKLCTTTLNSSGRLTQTR